MPNSGPLVLVRIEVRIAGGVADWVRIPGWIYGSDLDTDSDPDARRFLCNSRASCCVTEAIELRGEHGTRESDQ